MRKIKSNYHALDGDFGVVAEADDDVPKVKSMPPSIHSQFVHRHRRSNKKNITVHDLYRFIPPGASNKREGKKREHLGGEEHVLWPQL